METFGEQNNSVDHKECIEKIEALQETIFDMEQKTIGVDLEVDKRVKIIGEHLEFNLRKTIHEDYEVNIVTLKEELKKLADRNRFLE